MSRHIPRIYLPQGLVAGATVRVEGDAAHHLLHVLRLKAGAPLVLFNGQGGEYSAAVRQTSKHALEAQVGDRREVRRESPIEITLAQALIRSERMDYAIQKAIELGVVSIQPVLTEHSLHLEHERVAKKLTHWRAVAQSAAAQCGRAVVPEVQPLQTLASWLPQTGRGLKLALEPQGVSLKKLKPANVLTLLVGPEAGLSAADLHDAEAAGFQRLALGPRILRTETAGPAALAAIQSLWGDLG